MMTLCLSIFIGIKGDVVCTQIKQNQKTQTKQRNVFNFEITLLKFLKL